MSICEKTQLLISGYIDQELTQQQRQMVQVHLDDCEKCAALHKDLLAIQQTIQQTEYPDCEEQKLAKILHEPMANKLSMVGWVLIAIPLIVLFFVHFYVIFTSGFKLFSIQTLWLLVEVGGLLLLASVIRQRWLASKTDKYKNVKL